MSTIREISFSKIKTVPVPFDVRESVKNTLAQYLRMAERKFGRTFSTPSISFDLRGKTAGKAFIAKNHIQLNAVLLLENFDDFLADTVPHELAHLLTHALYKKASAHGPEWKLVMRTLNVNPQRCHSYDVSNARTQKTLTYACACPGHVIEVSVRHHNKIQRGAQYRCKKCKCEIIPLGTATLSKPVLSEPIPTSPLRPAKPPVQAWVLPASRGASRPGAVVGTASVSSSTSRTEPPSERQLSYAKFLAAKKRLTIPAVALVCKTQMSRWISAHA